MDPEIATTKKNAGAIGTLTGAGDEGAKHTGDGRAGAGKSAGNDMLNNALWQQFWNAGLGTFLSTFLGNAYNTQFLRMEHADM